MASLGIMEALFMAPRTITARYRIEGFKEGPELGPYYAERRSLSDGGCIFFSRLELSEF